jgi:hypothetical protein
MLIRDPGWNNSDSGSGINIPDPQHRPDPYRSYRFGSALDSDQYSRWEFVSGFRSDKIVKIISSRYTFTSLFKSKL